MVLKRFLVVFLNLQLGNKQLSYEGIVVEDLLWSWR